MCGHQCLHSALRDVHRQQHDLRHLHLGLLVLQRRLLLDLPLRIVPEFDRYLCCLLNGVLGLLWVSHFVYVLPRQLVPLQRAVLGGRLPTWIVQLWCLNLLVVLVPVCLLLDIGLDVHQLRRRAVPVPVRLLCCLSRGHLPVQLNRLLVL